MRKRDKIALCCLLLVTVLLCIAVSFGLEQKEQARIRAPFPCFPNVSRKPSGAPKQETSC